MGSGTWAAKEGCINDEHFEGASATIRQLWGDSLFCAPPAFAVFFIE
jgi:hypothetical protein